MKSYIDEKTKHILHLKETGAPKIEIQKAQQELDELMAKDVHDIKCPYEFLYWN